MRVLIVRNNYNTKAIEAALVLEAFLASQGIEYAVYDTDDLRSSTEITKQEKVSDIDSFDLAVVLGGDGTILRTAAQIKYRRIPILGINFGNLGFMANSNAEGVVPIVAAALSGEIIEEHRTNLVIDVFLEGEEGGGIDDEIPSHSPHRFFALNEMVLARGAQGRIIDCSYSVDGAKVADVRGDGLVVATATGSTAYALSLGGPLVTPMYGGLIIIPIAPHSLHSRPILTAPSDVAEVFLCASSANRQASMFIDGDLIEMEKPICRVVVSTGEDPTVLLRYKPETFYTHASQVFFR